jgi:RNA polymerase sigma-70 factor (ECF subfamily)
LSVPADHAPRNQSRSQIGRLTRQLARGNEGAFERFHALYADRLYRYLLVVARGDEPMVREAMQDCMLRVLRHVRPFESEEVLWSWLTRVGKSALIDLVRRRKRVETVERESALSDRISDTGDEARAGDRMMDALRAAMAALAESDRALLERHYVDGVRQSELAEKLGTTRKAVESRLARLRKKLRPMIRDILSHE